MHSGSEVAVSEKQRLKLAARAFRCAVEILYDRVPRDANVKGKLDALLVAADLYCESLSA